MEFGDKQYEAIDILNDPAVDELLLGGAKGGSKASPLTAIVYTPFGPKKMGDIQIGDRVSNPDGSIAKVVGVWPQGIKKIACVVMDDGASVRVSWEHLWLYKIRGKTRFRKLAVSDRPTQYKIGTTKQLFDLVKKGVRIQIPITQPVQFTIASNNPEITWPLEPYTLGILLGDGHIGNGSVTITSADPSIVEGMAVRSISRKSNNLACSYRMPLDIRDKCKSLGLCGKRSWEKFIPSQYKICTLSMRQSLMQGLMDTDGSADKRGHSSYTTTSEQLSKDVQWLAWSLGYKANIISRIPKYTYKGIKKEGRLAYTVYIKGNSHEQLFRLERKQKRAEQAYLGNGINGGSDRVRHIISITPDGKEEAQCITVDNPNGLYITDDFIVTHNSVTGCWLLFTMCYAIAREFWPDKPPKEPVQIAWMGRKIAADFSKTTLETWRRIIPPEYYEIKGRPEEIVIADRVKIITGGLDSRDEVEKFNSMELAVAFLDQAEETSREDVACLRATFRLHINGKLIKGKLIMSCNPRQCWLKEEFILNPKPNQRFLQMLYTDNPFIDHDDYARRLDTAYSFRPALLRAYKEGDWNAVEDPEQIIKSEWLNQVKIRPYYDPFIKEYLVIDCARFGDDNTIILRMKNAEIAEKVVMPYCDTTQIESKAAQMSFANGNLPIVVESIGADLGAGVVDHLRGAGKTIYEFCPNAAAPLMEEENYGNLRCWAWANAAKKLEKGILDEVHNVHLCTHNIDERTITQLCAIRYQYKNGKLYVEDKAEIKKPKRLGCSPDDADTYVIALWAYDQIPVPFPKSEREQRLETKRKDPMLM
jgi:hypothetical protein